MRNTVYLKYCADSILSLYRSFLSVKVLLASFTILNTTLVIKKKSSTTHQFASKTPLLRTVILIISCQKYVGVWVGVHDPSTEGMQYSVNKRIRTEMSD